LKEIKDYSVQFNLSLAQIQSFTDPEIYFVFVICRNNQWTNLLVVPREDLSDLFTEHKIGSIVNDQLILYFTFSENEIVCSKVDFTRFHNNFEDFQLILH
jgi:hypothetical protein